MSLFGLKIVSQPLAVEKCVDVKVVMHSLRKKKRKNWRIVMFDASRPGCWKIGDTLYMHPDLIEKLESAT